MRQTRRIPKEKPIADANRLAAQGHPHDSVSARLAKGPEPMSESAVSRPAARHQPWCDADVPTDASRCPRCGVWQPLNRGAWKTGASSRQLLESPEALAAVAEHRCEIEADLGDGLSRIGRDLVHRYVETSLIATTLGADLATRGILTAKGRQRAALTAYLQVLDRQHRLALALGLERKTRRVTPMQAIAAEPEVRA